MKKLFSLLLLAAMLLSGVNVVAQVKPVLQQSDPTQADTYLANRRALTGRHCVPNKLINVVGVGSWVTDMNNLTDEDLTNHATIPSAVDAGVTVNPIVSVRDMKHHYAAGTTAGFTLVAGSGSSLLDLDIINAYAIMFLCEGQNVGTVAVTTGQTAGGVGLSLITIPGSSDVDIELSAAAPAEFDEVVLMPSGGVNLSAVTSTQVKYAFVGNLVQHTITETSMQEYAAAHGRNNFTLDQGKIGQTGYVVGDDLINDDLTDGYAWGVIAIGTSLDARVGAAPDRNDPDQSQPFKAGTLVGFKFSQASLLNLPVGSGIVIHLYKGEWVNKGTTLIPNWQWDETEVQSETVSANVLKLSLVSGGEQEVSIIAKEDFSHARINFPTGLTVNLGGTKVFYAYVCDTPDVDHQCDIVIDAPTQLCDTQASYQLTNTGSVEVTWSVVSQPAGANASIDSNGLLTGMTVDGPYVVRATSSLADGCYQETTITRGVENTESMCDTPVFNVGDDMTYALSSIAYDSNFTLLSINASVSDAENILNPTFEDYASYTGGVTLLDNAMVVGVRKTDGPFSDGSDGKRHRVGFVVETRSTGLGANLLDLFNIRTYNNGVQTYSSVVKESNVLKVGLIGSSKVQKIRFAVTVPAGTAFNEFQLYTTGVLNVDIDKLNIYYAFEEALADGEDELSACADPLACSGMLVSNDATNATINGNATRNIEVLSVAKVTDNLSYLIDDDINTAVMVANTVSAGGTVLAIDLGRVYTASQQIGIIIDNAAYLAGVNAGNWLTLATYRNGVATGDEHNDWSVLGANVIGYGDKDFLFMQPTQEYDEIRITMAGVLTALDYTHLYGLFVRNDADADGTPDCLDEYSCSDELVLDEEAVELNKAHDYSKAHLVLHRTLNMGEWHPIVLPVDLTGLQVRNAFGNSVKIAEPTHLEITPYVTNINFSSLTFDDEVVLHRGEFYLINTARNPELAAGETYESVEGTINGPIYFIDGVDYVKAESEQPIEDGMVTVSHNAPRAHLAPATQSVALHGSYVYMNGVENEQVAAGNYVFNTEGVLDEALEDTPMLGFRYYVENLTDTPINVVVDGTVTAVHDLNADALRALTDPNVYTITGQNMGSKVDVKQLPAGIYIIKGRKVQVK